MCATSLTGCAAGEGEDRQVERDLDQPAHAGADVRHAPRRVRALWADAFGGIRTEGQYRQGFAWFEACVPRAN